jgi:hypothetical protein
MHQRAGVWMDHAMSAQSVLRLSCPRFDTDLLHASK